jgi:hypothetical protein
MIKTYKAFGFIFSSDFEIPELIEIKKTDKINFKIEKGTVPKEIEKPEKKGVFYQISQKEFLLNIKDTADYYVYNSEKIIVQPHKNAKQEAINLFLLGSVIGVIIFQKNKIPFHGSSVIINNKAIIISGVSGAGKSTIVANFIKKGFPLLSDDVVSLFQDDKKILAEPGFPQIKLWEDSLKMLSINKKLKKIRPELNKYRYPVKNFETKNHEISAIFIIKTKNTFGVEINEIKGVEKFKILNRNIYRKQFIEGLKVQKNQFKIISNLAASTKVYIIERPNANNTIEDVSKKIIEKLG